MKSLYPRLKYVEEESPLMLSRNWRAKKTVYYRIVQFEDEIFSMNVEWLKEFLDMYSKRIGVPFECYIFEKQQH